MIAATDPQEFIPGGRQQVSRHPGPPEANYKHGCLEDDFLLNRLEKVSITENNSSSEQWTIRKSPNSVSKSEIKSSTEEKTNEINKSYVSNDNNSHNDLLIDDSWGCISADYNVSGKHTSKRISDVNTSKFLHGKRFLNDESKSSCNTNKSFSGNNQNNFEPVRFKSEIGYIEEELYVKGNIVVWSKGLSYNASDSARTTICSYASQHPVQHAIWCTFYMESADSFSSVSYNHSANEDDVRGDPLPCVCIIDREVLKICSKDSENFSTTLPFQVRRVWNTKFGLLLEKESKDQNKDIHPTMFSLTHPLDEIRPVGLCRSSCSQIIEDPHLQIVFTSENPSICMMYDSTIGYHSVCKIRRIKQDEIFDRHNKTTDTTAPSAFGLLSKHKNPYVSAFEGNKSCLQQAVSPFSSKATSVASLIGHFSSRNPSPLITMRSGSAISSVLSNNGGNSWRQKLHVLRLDNSHRTLDNVSRIPEANLSVPTFQHMEPTFCLEYIWTEGNQINQDDNRNEAASNVFLIDDVTGQWYLCYLVSSKSHLCVVKVDYSNPACIVFGMVTHITATVSAVGIPHLHMLALLEISGNIILYSGLSVVGKLHIGGVLAQHVPSPFALRKTPKVFNSPFPRRSSLLPTSASTDPRFDDHLLSPVLPSMTATRSNNILQFPFTGSDSYSLGGGGDSGKIYLYGLKDAVEDRITLQYSDGSYYRITLPSLVSSSLVESCLNVLRYTLQRDATNTLLTKWYAKRNAPGSVDLTMEREWLMFTTLLLELTGFESLSKSDGHIEFSLTPSCSAKRQKQSLGTENDWKYLVKSTQHKVMHNHFSKVLHLHKRTLPPPEEFQAEINVNTNSVLFPYVKLIHFTLHLLYEDLKLNILRRDELPMLAKFLSRFSDYLDLKYYVMHYWKDFPTECKPYRGKNQRETDCFKNLLKSNVMGEMPDGILDYLFRLLGDGDVKPYPIIESVNNRSRDILQLCVTYLKTEFGKELVMDDYMKVVPIPGKKNVAGVNRVKLNVTNETAAQKVVVMMSEMNLNSRDLESYPMGVNFILHDALWSCRENPPSDWPAEAYHLLHRPDLASQSQIIDSKKQTTLVKHRYTMFSHINEVLPVINNVVEGVHEDGMEEVDGTLLKLRFSDDLRVAETRRLLQSSKPVAVVLSQRPDVSDHDFIEEQERHLYAICTRTMSLPVGRGMFTLRTATPVITEPLPIPPLCLTGKAPPMGTTVELTHIDTPPNMNLWPLFHNGVANGLRIDPDARNIDSTWIVFNKPRNISENGMEHAGFLMALGLNGHLKNLNVVNTFEYLSITNEVTSAGLLLGLSCAYRGTASTYVTKMLSIHIEALLPPTSMELDIAQVVQVASLLGVGLLYQSTAHRHITEVLLTEIGRPPGPEMENSVDRESYSLAAGLALGLVTLRQGGRPSGLSDLNVPDTLHYYMIGGNKRPLIGSQKEKYKVPSFQIREGNSVNLDVTAPGSTLALGLMYLGTGNVAIADWMAPPDTQYLLDFVRPDFLMLRILSRALIMWNDIEPEKEWVENQVPKTIKPFCMVKPSVMLDIDYEAMNQAYCNIIAGACFALGLKFAGSADETAFETLLEYCHMFTSLTSKSIAELAGKPTIETCLNVVLLSAAMVMAGTGNLEIMRIVRYLRRRVGLSSSAVVTYGSHLAIHMALGLLFLGGGRYTLSNSPSSVAALICAFYPKFPTHSNDNRYHLQAFRNLYVLAVEPRLVIPKDITMGRMCYANITVIKLDGTTISLRGPGLIPDLNTLYKVCIKDDRYWPVVFERERNWDQLLKLLSSCCCIDVKQRAGCLSYIEDKNGLKSDLIRTLTQSSVMPWDPEAKAIVSFSSDCIVRHFADHFLNIKQSEKIGKDESKLTQNLTRTTYDCVIKDKLSVLPLFISIIKIVKDLNSSTNSVDLWNFKIICTFILKNRAQSAIAAAESILAYHQEALTTIDNWEPELRAALKSYILGTEVECGEDLRRKLANYVTFYNLPFELGINNVDLWGIMCTLNNKGHNSETIDRVLRIIGYIR